MCLCRWRRARRGALTWRGGERPPCRSEPQGRLGDRIWVSTRHHRRRMATYRTLPTSCPPAGLPLSLWAAGDRVGLRARRELPLIGGSMATTTDRNPLVKPGEVTGLRRLDLFA